jgi:hypothetical protein
MRPSRRPASGPAVLARPRLETGPVTPDVGAAVALLGGRGASREADGAQKASFLEGAWRIMAGTLLLVSPSCQRSELAGSTL